MELGERRSGFRGEKKNAVMQTLEKENLSAGEVLQG